MERSKSAAAPEVIAEQFQPGVCGSCHWRRGRFQLGSLQQVCSVMPKQVTAVAQSVGVHVICMHPVIDNLAEETCAMWKECET